jgi:hypothetical protein
MFNNKIASKNSSSVALKKYCKVCHDAGKSESEYQSHFIRENTNPNSKVVCPTLLSLECRYCSKKGHTVKYCKFLEKDKKLSSRRQENIINNQTNKDKVKDKQSNNIFDNLDSDSEEEEDEKEKLPEIRFVEPVSTSNENKYLPKSYASVLSTPVVEPVKKVVNLPVLLTSTSATEQKEKVESSTRTFNVAKYIGKSWADDDDTESESDIDEENNYDPNW